MSDRNQGEHIEFLSAEYQAATDAVARSIEIMGRLRGRADVQHPPWLTKMNAEIDRYIEANTANGWAHRNDARP